MRHLLEIDIRTVILVTLVSVLVWVWAEGESLTTIEPRVQIEVYAEPKGDYVLRLEAGPGAAGAGMVGVGNMNGGGSGGGNTNAGAGGAGGVIRAGTITGVPNVDGRLGAVSDGGGAIMVVPGFVKLRIEGPTALSQEAARELESKTLRLVAPIEDLAAQEGEIKTIDLLPLLKKLETVSPYASVLAETEPKSIQVRMIPMVRRQVPVKVVTPEGVSLDGEPAAGVSGVEVRVPESVAAMLGESTPARLEFEGTDAEKLKEEGPLTLTATVRAPEMLAGALVAEGVPASMVTMSPEKSQVTLRVRRRVESYTLRTVPVWVLLQGTELRDTSADVEGGLGVDDGSGRWDVRLVDAFLSDVTVSGPADGVAKVRSGEASVRAIVELSWEDLAKGIKQKQATFAGLPNGVTAGAANTTVGLKIVRRGNGGGTSEPGSGE